MRYLPIHVDTGLGSLEPIAIATAIASIARRCSHPLVFVLNDWGFSVLGGWLEMNRKSGERVIPFIVTSGSCYAQSLAANPHLWATESALLLLDGVVCLLNIAELATAPATNEGMFLQTNMVWLEGTEWPDASRPLDMEFQSSANDHDAGIVRVDGRIGRYIKGPWYVIREREDQSPEIPRAILRWRGGRPWRPGKAVWRSEVWESERCALEAVKRDEWQKPIAWEVAADPKDIFELGRRGWKVVAVAEGRKNLDEIRKKPLQDVIVLRTGTFKSKWPTTEMEAPHFLRCGTLAQVRRLAESGVLPPYVAIKGPVKAGTVKTLRKLGYLGFSAVERARHQGGGPLAEGLDYEPEIAYDCLEKGWELHACRDPGMALRP